MGQTPGLSIQVELDPELWGCKTHIIYPQSTFFIDAPDQLPSLRLEPAS